MSVSHNKPVIGSNPAIQKTRICFCSAKESLLSKKTPETSPAECKPEQAANKQSYCTAVGRSHAPVGRCLFPTRVMNSDEFGHMVRQRSSDDQYSQNSQNTDAASKMQNRQTLHVEFLSAVTFESLGYGTNLDCAV